MSMRSWVGMAAMVVLAGMAVSAEAQPGRGPGGGFGGRGGFGGGNSPTSLATIAAVQKELNVTEAQAEKLKALNDEVRSEIQQATAGGNENLRDLPEEERRAKFAELAAKRTEAVRKVNDKFKPKLAEILDAKQITRLNQIVLQQSGSQIYTNPDVVKALKLTQDQQDKLAAITQEFGEKSRELFGQGGRGGAGGGDAQERMAKVRELNESRDKAYSEVLTAAQRDQLAALKGEPFEMPRGNFGNFGGGNREGGNRGNREGGRGNREGGRGEGRPGGRRPQ